jgi:DNA-binding LytR/AlgR family response regulator
MVIFTTAHPDYALEAFRNDAVDYLLKPISFDKLVKAVNKAVFMIKAKSLYETIGYKFIRSEGKYHRLNFSDILYVEGMKDYVKVYSSTGTLTVAMNLSSIMEKLPDDIFIRVHKSYIVNKRKITKFDSFELHIDAQTIPIGNAYRELMLQEVLTDQVIRK